MTRAIHIVKRCVFLLLSAGLCSTAAYGEDGGAGSPLSGTAEDRIVVFADVHGGARELRVLLGALTLIDPSGNWTGGRTRLISLGDLLDRGPDSRAVMDLLMKLETQAAEAGGAVHLVLGNHELMNMTGDLRYVSDAEYAAFAVDEDPTEREDADSQAFPLGYFAHRAAFAPDGEYGSWLLQKPQILVLDGIAFVHGGLSDRFVEASIPAYNENARNELWSLLNSGRRLVDTGVLSPAQDLLTAEPVDGRTLPADFMALRGGLQFDSVGPAWYRGTAACHALIEQPRFEAVLSARGLERVVMGHTPTNPRIIQTRFGDRAVLADTGMYADYYRGRPSAAIFDGPEMRTLTLGADGKLVAQRGRPAVDVRSTLESSWLENVRTALADLTLMPDETTPFQANGRRLEAVWHKDSRREQSARMAAFALDQLLGFGLVAPVLFVEQAGRAGVVEVIPAGTLSEFARVTGNVYRPNYCAGGSDFDLLLVLDALMGQEDRNGSNLIYDRATWLIYLTGQNKAFPRQTRLPRYLTDQTITLTAPVAGKLSGLDEQTLNATLGEYLDSRQIQAILERRDRVLERWPAGK